MAVLSVTGCSHAPTKPASPPGVTVEFTHASRQPISDIVTGGGVIYPLHQASLAPKVSSPVKRFYVNRGDPVRRGQLLAVLGNGDLAGAAVTAEGGYDQARATHTKAIAAGIVEVVKKQEQGLDIHQGRAIRRQHGMLSPEVPLAGHSAAPKPRRGRHTFRWA